jgi:NAD-dependent deacetylase
MTEKIVKFAKELIAESQSVVTITGAGISVASGIPPFRGESGLWTRFDPEKYASLRAFIENPRKSWELFMEMYIEFAGAKPNEGHYLLASMESRGNLKHVITQNIDGLHQQAGTQSITEIHGNMRNFICLDCGQKISSRGMILDSEDLPPRCYCGGVLKPDFTLFGESISPDRYFTALKHIRSADILLLIGTSGVFHPVNEFPEIALDHGARIIEINIEKTLLTETCNTVFLRGSIPETLKKLFH